MPSKKVLKQLPVSELPPVPPAFKQANDAMIEQVKRLAAAATDCMLSDTIGSFVKPSGMAALRAVTGVDIGDVILYQGEVHEVTDESFRFYAKISSLTVYAKAQTRSNISFDGVDVTCAFYLGGNEVVRLQLSPNGGTWKTNRYSNTVALMKPATQDDVGYSLPNIAQVKGWIRKLFGSCKDEELGVNLSFKERTGNTHYRSSYHKASDIICSAVVMQERRRYDPTNGGYEATFVVKARLVKVAMGLKDYVARRGCAAEVVTANDGSRMTIEFSLVKKARADKKGGD